MISSLTCLAPPVQLDGVICKTSRMSHVDRIARVKIELDDWQPAIWRRVEVPLTATLKALHDVVQAAMPFEDYHLFEFRADGKRYAIPSAEWDELLDRTYSAKSMKLGTLIDRGVRELTYTYDFGDNWQHTITIEATTDADPAVEYPRYIDGAGRAPPEDVGAFPASTYSSKPWPIQSTRSIATTGAGMVVRLIRRRSKKTKSAKGSNTSPDNEPSVRPASQGAVVSPADDCEQGRYPLDAYAIVRP